MVANLIKQQKTKLVNLSSIYLSLARLAISFALKTATSSQEISSL